MFSRTLIRRYPLRPGHVFPERSYTRELFALPSVIALNNLRVTNCESGNKRKKKTRFELQENIFLGLRFNFVRLRWMNKFMFLEGIFIHVKDESLSVAFYVYKHIYIHAYIHTHTHAHAQTHIYTLIFHYIIFLCIFFFYLMLAFFASFFFMFFHLS